MDGAKLYRWWCEACGTLTNTGDCDCTRFENTRKKQRLRPADFDEPEPVEGDTQMLWDSVAEKNAQIDQLRKTLKALVDDVLEYERINKLAPNPGRKYCWQSLENAIDLLAKYKM